MSWYFDRARWDWLDHGRCVETEAGGRWTDTRPRHMRWGGGRGPLDWHETTSYALRRRQASVGLTRDQASLLGDVTLVEAVLLDDFFPVDNPARLEAVDETIVTELHTRRLPGGDDIRRQVRGEEGQGDERKHDLGRGNEWHEHRR